MDDHLGAVLSGASLLAAIIAVLYSLWYPAIEEALKVQRRLHVDDRQPEIEVVDRVLRGKAIPLVSATAVQAGVFLPDAVGIVGQGLAALGKGVGFAIQSYDSVRAAFLVVYAGSVLLFVLAIGAMRDLRAKRTWLKSSDS